MPSFCPAFSLNEPLLTPVLSHLALVMDEHLGRSLLEADIVKDVALNGRCLDIALTFPYPCYSQKAAIEKKIAATLSAITEIDTVKCHIDFDFAVQSPQTQSPINNVKHVIAVASGKGGVGKSTTAVNLALALAAEGAKVGVLDADIYGPSIPIMLGIPNFKPVSPDGKVMMPANVHGIVAQSIGFIVDTEQAAVWRGPMAAGALVQLINETQWPELDYMVIDLPPGTGDIQLTLSQKVPLSGAVIVTTPQDIALADAQKGINMFQKVNVPVLGIVENMSFHLCSQCGHQEHPFGRDGGQKMATRYGLPLLGQLPLTLAIREDVDKGVPSVVATPHNDIAQLYLAIARQVGAELALSKAQPTVSISMSNE
ncbi:iron-sulfur cluster carrier protein ApbC [uncultured Shewanella sp.]|uniref:iron-sulfur cluster carrier protein ApbC n=1 Tax=uncultured Shewanella sp. TaxID=173975 RepID=UPI0026368024|nr:iron-sulfur cluster carrier protein ApbC [uncultured Shewanella sp.]